MNKRNKSSFFESSHTNILKKILLKVSYIPFNSRVMWYKVWNKYILFINDIKFGKNLIIINKIYIKKHATAQIEIGDNFTFSNDDAINPLSRNLRGCIFADENSTIKFGNNVGISSACIWAKENIEIGNNVLIGGDCIIMDTDAHNLDYKIRAAKAVDERGRNIDKISAKSSPIKIEDNVLIGTRCIILKGVTIGARSIIGSGSVVTKSIPSDCIAAGNPCKAIKSI